MNSFYLEQIEIFSAQLWQSRNMLIIVIKVLYNVIRRKTVLRDNILRRRLRLNYSVSRISFYFCTKLFTSFLYARLTLQLCAIFTPILLFRTE